MDINELVAKYVMVRDKKAELVAKQKLAVKQFDDVLDAIEVSLLKYFNENGIDSVKTAGGTAYVSTRESATVADWDSFREFVQNNGAWEMLEHRCNKTAVSEYRAANDDLPPGVNWREERTVNIRRA